MKIEYVRSQYAWKQSEYHRLKTIIEKFGVKRILEVGGGANPTFPLEYINTHSLEYTILDISEVELAKAPEGYLKIQGDISANSSNLTGAYDLVFSKWLAEHIKNGENFHRNVYQLLANGGVAFHFFPTMYALPFVVNRLLPEKLTESVLSLIQSGREKKGKHAKFPAYYSWCRGPMDSQIRRFELLDYQVYEYIGFYGHNEYYKKVPIILKIHQKISSWLLRHPIPWLTSFASVTLVKQEGLVHTNQERRGE